MTKSTRRLSVIAVLAVMACSSEQLPLDAELTISPNQRSFEIDANAGAGGACVINPDVFLDIPFVVSLRNGEGAPLGDMPLQAYLSLAENTFSGYPVLALYEDRNGNGVVDADSELVSGADDYLARFRTDRLSGSHALLVRANVSCPYRGELFVFGNGVTAEAGIEVRASVAGLEEESIE